MASKSATPSVDIAAITAAVVAALQATDTPDTGADTPKPTTTTRKGGRTASPRASSARKPKPTTDGYTPDAKRRKQRATARQLWALNEAGLLHFDGTFGDPLLFGDCFDAIAATRA